MFFDKKICVILSFFLLWGKMYLVAAPRTNSFVAHPSTAGTSIVVAPISVVPVTHPTTKSVVTHPTTFGTSVVTHPKTTSIVTHPVTTSVVTHPSTWATSVVTHPKTTSIVTHPQSVAPVVHPGEQSQLSLVGTSTAAGKQAGNTVPSSKSPTSMSDYKAPQAKDFNAAAAAAAGPTTTLGLTGKADESSKDSSMASFNAQHDPQKAISAALSGGPNLGSLSSSITKEVNATNKK